MNRIGILIVLGFCFLFFIITSFFLEKNGGKREQKIEKEEEIIVDKNNFDNQKEIVNRLFSDVKIIYDVVNNKFKVDQEDTIVIGDITYKKITNFDDVMKSLFTENGIKKYISDMGSYFAYTENGYYLAGNLVSYQTYYFRGDDSNIYITSADENRIDGIIYTKWTSNNQNTLATIRVVRENNNWLIDDITLLSTK